MGDDEYMDFKGFEGDEDAQYALWSKQLKKHESKVVLDDIDAIIAEEDYDEEDYDYEEWN